CSRGAPNVKDHKGKEVLNEDEDVENEDDSDYDPESDLSTNSDKNFNNNDDDYCGDDPLFDVDITLEEIQQEVRQKKKARPVREKGKRSRERISSGLSDDEGINSDELDELDSEDDEEGGGE
ncbi:hypothetical protein PIB30_094962, partial [Stylosanthes scabra]|nr:hypothetical protein [Stylosanthes scabra]